MMENKEILPVVTIQSQKIRRSDSGRCQDKADTAESRTDK